MCIRDRYRCAFEEAIFKGTFSGNLETYDKVQSICNDKVIDYCIYNSMLEYFNTCLLYTSPSPRDLSTSRMPSSACKKKKKNKKKKKKKEKKKKETKKKI
eukprot:TRINITY_DN6843_c0_g2_i4.p1 TRINITY_DN6843_c0_g2~~TRINITY_DN6843_c0_g2_i4.p1  ORF type:complete len:100 (-),score=43.82 TRINITY_DN6843_c0_g2_i4:9-308(-)